MDLLVLLTWIGAIGAGITIWKAVKWRRNSDDLPVDDANSKPMATLRSPVVISMEDAVTNSENIRIWLDNLSSNGVRVGISKRLVVGSQGRLVHRITRKSHTSVPEQRSKNFRRLTHGLPKELHPYKEEIVQFVEDGKKERRAVGKSTKPYVLSEAFHIGVTILKAKFKLSIIRRRSIK